MIIKTRQQFEKLLEQMAECPEVTLDTETTGLDLWHDDRLCGIGLELSNKETFYLPFRHKEFDSDMSLLALLANDEYNLPLYWLEELWEALAQVPKLIGHNIKFDLAAVHQDGYVSPYEQEIEETLSGARLYYKEDKPNMALDNVTKDLQGLDQSAWKQKFKDYLIDRKIENHYDRAEIPIIADYCESDCKFTRMNRDKLHEYALATNQEPVYEAERKVVKIFWNLEAAGLRIDKEYIGKAITESERVLKLVYQELIDIVGNDFNPWSNPQLTKIFEQLGQKIISRTKTGQPSWADDVLKRVVHPIAKVILNWRAIDKMLQTYFYPYLAQKTEYVHPNFKSWGTRTGRVSCTNPNLQQLSRSVEWDIDCAPDFDIQVRRMFIPPDGYSLVLMDYSQMEMIVFADFIQDPVLSERLNQGQVDFHALVATMIWNVQPSHPEFQQYRSNAKAISLGLIYMMGIARLAASLNCSEEEAREFRRVYFLQFPTAQDFIYKVRQRIRDPERGYVFNKFGRRYYITDDPEKNDYKAINYLVQGTAADIVKQAMIRIDALIHDNGYLSRFAFQLHDEFGFYIENQEYYEIVPQLKLAMEHKELNTFLPVDISIGDMSWSDKKKICKICFEREDMHACSGNKTQAVVG